MTSLDSSDEDDSEEEIEEEEKAKPQDQLDEDIPKWEKINGVVNEIAELFPFDIFRKEYLDILNNDTSNYKVRVYLISAQNLTATGVVIDFKSRLAGMSALCTANPYAVFKVGDGYNNPETRNIKSINDREFNFESELNPKFFVSKELDVIFPEDWKLEVSIMDKTMFEYTDTLIGSTTIDLENRHFANTLWLDRQAVVKEQDLLKDEMKLAGKEKDKKKAKLKQ